MKIRFKTTRELFCFGLAWRNESTYEYMVGIIIGCVVMEIRWKKDFNEQ